MFTKIENTTALEYRITGARPFRAGLRQLKKTFAHPIEAKTMNTKIHGHHIGQKDPLLTSTLHDMAPEIHRGVKQAVGGALSR